MNNDSCPRKENCRGDQHLLTRPDAMTCQGRRSFSGRNLTVQIKFLDACFMKH
jgi:hypothetical protein